MQPPCHVVYPIAWRKEFDGLIRWRRHDMTRIFDILSKFVSSCREAKYLGAAIKLTSWYRRGNRTTNLEHYHANFETPWYLLEQLSCSRKGKLLVYNSVVISRLLYGLESLQTTDSTGKLLNTFELKGLRKILHLHTTCIDRNNSNEFVCRRADAVVGDGWCFFSGTSLQNQTFDWNVGNEPSQTTWACAEKTLVTPSTSSHCCFLCSFTKSPGQSKSRQTQKALAWGILKANDDGHPNLNFDHQTLVIREALNDAARDFNPLSTDHRDWCDRTLFERYSVWTSSVWNVCAWGVRHGIR